jgi:uncharacterized membrane protein YbjE (DUF340 family)
LKKNTGDLNFAAIMESILWITVLLTAGFIIGRTLPEKYTKTTQILMRVMLLLLLFSLGINMAKIPDFARKLGDNWLVILALTMAGLGGSILVAGAVNRFYPFIRKKTDAL